jgi:hypothetical protein
VSADEIVVAIAGKAERLAPTISKGTRGWCGC